MNRRIAGYTYLALLVVSLVTPILLVTALPVVHAARGNSILAAVTCDLAAGVCTDIKTATYTVSIKAGSDRVEAVDGDTAYRGWYFALVLNPVEFDGSIFSLYISKNGFSYITGPPEDVWYAGNFTVVDLVTPGLKRVEVTSDMYLGGKATFYIGTVTIRGVAYRLVIGPVPFWLANLTEYRYIKVFDGLATQVAVSLQTVTILPAFLITPTEGPGNRTIEFAGTGLPPYTCINLTYHPTWSNVTPVTYVWIPDYHNATNYPDKCPERTQLIANESGFVYARFNVTDLRLNWTGRTSIPYRDVAIYIWNVTDTRGDPTRSRLIDSVTYRQYARSIVELRSVRRNYIAQPFVSLYTGAGNNTLIVKAYGNHTVEDIVLSGAWWNPGATITIDVLGFANESLTWTVPLNESGFFNVTIRLPVADPPHGLNATVTYIVAIDETVAGLTMRYIFNIMVVRPSITVVPTSGYVGDVVRVELREFPFNMTAGLWWNSTCPDLGKIYPVNMPIVNITAWWFNVANVTVLDMEGGSAVTTITIPRDTGGVHEIRGCVPWNCTDTVIVDTTALPLALRAFFRILPKIEIRHSVTGTNVFDNDGMPVYVVLTGLVYGRAYLILVDNQASIWGRCDRCGYLNVTLIAAGFRPGLHVVTLYALPEVPTVPPEGEVTPEYYALFTVTCRGDPICTRLELLNATLVAVNGTIVTINTTLGTLVATLDTLAPVITRIDGNVATLLTEIGIVKAEVATIRALVSAANTMLVSISGDVALIKTDAGYIRAKLDTLEPVILRTDGNVAKVLTRIGVIESSLEEIKKLVELGNARLTKIESDLAVIQTDLIIIRANLSALAPVITRIDGGVATLLTEIGVIRADVSTIRSLVETGNAMLIAINGTVAAIRTDTGIIRANLTALAPVITRIDSGVATVLTEVGVVRANLTTIRSLVETGNAVLVAVNGTLAVIRTDVGTIRADVAAIRPTITAISGDVATIKTDIGTVKADVSAIRPVVTKIDGDVAKVQTAIGELKGIVERIDGNVATIRTDVGTIKADVSDVKGRVSAVQSDVGDVKKDVAAVKDSASKAAENTGAVPLLSTAIWIAVIFSIISAALAAYSVVTIRKKIAG